VSEVPSDDVVYEAIAVVVDVVLISYEDVFRVENAVAIRVVADNIMVPAKNLPVVIHRYYARRWAAVESG
jgi:hypothetical protein